MFELLQPIYTFLQCKTPDAWINEAKKPENLSILLRDHLLCELKAAQSAMYLIRKYAVEQTSQDSLFAWFKVYEDFAYRKIGDLATLKRSNQLPRQIRAREDNPYNQNFINKMVLLIKEELHHFCQVLEVMASRNIAYTHIKSGRYARALLRQAITHEPDVLVDKLIIHAFIEARSCERFAKLAPHLDADLSKFYISLLRSEARHYRDYIQLAQQIAGRCIRQRIVFFSHQEAMLIQSPDADFKFHSGVPARVI